MEYDKEFPAGLASAVLESCFQIDGKENVMRIASSLFIADTTTPQTPPADVAKRAWPWITLDCASKSQEITGGTDIEYVAVSDLLLSPNKTKIGSFCHWFAFKS
eukprot:7629558-Karenia_brevis.AAC.1